MARKSTGVLTNEYIDKECFGELGRKVFYRHGANGLGLAVDWRSNKEAPTKTFVFETVLHGRNLRIKIGQFPAMSATQAEKKAIDLMATVGRGEDPRLNKRRQKEEQDEIRKIDHAKKVTLESAWNGYTHARSRGVKPLKARTLKDFENHWRLSFNDWHDKPLASITNDAISDKYNKLAESRGAAQSSQAMRYLKAVLNWAINRTEFSDAISSNPVSTLKMAKVEPDDRALLKQQLPEWFSAVMKLDNPCGKALLQFLLLTGTRRTEAIELEWSDLDLRWQSITFRDTKTNDDRVIPLTNYVAALILSLPRRNKYVFSSETSKEGEIVNPFYFLNKVNSLAGTDVSLHSLRKSFATLSDWCDIPDGVIKQIMGHKPQGVHEQHYRKRPLDMLAMHLQRFEDWLLTEAGLPIAEKYNPAARLQAVA